MLWVAAHSTSFSTLTLPLALTLNLNLTVNLTFNPNQTYSSRRPAAACQHV